MRVDRLGVCERNSHSFEIGSDRSHKDRSNPKSRPARRKKLETPPEPVDVTGSGNEEGWEDEGS